jgi:short subunit fatty acids transporter
MYHFLQLVQKYISRFSFQKYSTVFHPAVIIIIIIIIIIVMTIIAVMMASNEQDCFQFELGPTQSRFVDPEKGQVSPYS